MARRAAKCSRESSKMAPSSDFLEKLFCDDICMSHVIKVCRPFRGESRHLRNCACDWEGVGESKIGRVPRRVCQLVGSVKI